jgi:sigma-E factor negative regulatory protein RseC
MATERGIVTRLDSETAWVKTSRTSACKACASRDSCQMAENGQEMEVEAINAANARVGDKILLNVESSALLKVSFLLYIFPVLLMLAGAIIGEKIAPVVGVDPSLLSALLGFVSFGVAFFLIRFTHLRMARKECYRPRIVRIL